MKLRLYQRLKSVGRWVCEAYNLAYEAEIQLWKYILKDDDERNKKPIIS